MTLSTLPTAAAPSSATVSEVRAFWDSNPCGAHFIDVEFGTPEFFRAYADFRYRTEWHLNELVPFDQFRGKRVLEIGCGLGSDGARFAQNGADYTGIDLTPTAVKATSAHFAALGLKGQFLVQNAELLEDLRDQSYDLVYSHGVLHHTPNFDRALDQVHRVLRPGGRIVLMLYHRHSANYYLRILTYMRLRVMLYALRRAAGGRPGSYETHYQNLRAIGPGYLRAREFVNHCADGAACPIARVHTKRDLERMLRPRFDDISFRVAHLPLGKLFGSTPRRLEALLARHFGWYLFVYATKRSSP